MEGSDLRQGTKLEDIKRIVVQAVCFEKYR